MSGGAGGEEGRREGPPAPPAASVFSPELRPSTPVDSELLSLISRTRSEATSTVGASEVDIITTILQ